MQRQFFGLNLFWRTFAWLALLLVVVGLAWQLLFRALEAEPRALQAAQQLGDLVLLSRTAPLSQAGKLATATAPTNTMTQVM